MTNSFGPFSCAYSPECVEGEFSEVHTLYGLGPTPTKVATWHTKIRHLAYMLRSASVLQSEESLSRVPFESPPPKSSLAFLLCAPHSCAITFLM